MNSITGNEAAMALRSAEARLPSQPEEFEERMNWRGIVYVRVGQLALEISKAVQWGKALHEAIWRCSTACLMEEKELEGQSEKEKELEGERGKGKDGGGGDETGAQQQHRAQLPPAQPPPTPLAQPPPPQPPPTPLEKQPQQQYRQQQPPLTPPLDPTPEVDMRADKDAKQDALLVRLVETRSMLV